MKYILGSRVPGNDKRWREPSPWCWTSDLVGEVMFAAHWVVEKFASYHWRDLARSTLQSEGWQTGLMSRSEPELANRNHASWGTESQNWEPAAEVPERLRMCLRGWVLLKLSGDDASGCAAPTPQAVPKQEEEKRKCAGTRKGNLHFLQCPFVCVPCKAYVCLLPAAKTTYL